MAPFRAFAPSGFQSHAHNKLTAQMVSGSFGCTAVPNPHPREGHPLTPVQCSLLRLARGKPGPDRMKCPLSWGTLEAWSTNAPSPQGLTSLRPPAGCNSGAVCAFKDRPPASCGPRNSFSLAYSSKSWPPFYYLGWKKLGEHPQSLFEFVMSVLRLGLQPRYLVCSGFLMFAELHALMT